MHIIRKENILTYIDYLPIYKGLNIVEFGEETNSRENFKGTLCYRYNHIVHFVLDGHGEFHCNDKIYHLSAGQAFVITPQDLIRYEAAENESWTYCWLAFSGSDCQTLFEQCGFKTTAVFNFQDEMIAPLRKMAAQLRIETPTNENAYALSVASMAYEVLKNCALVLQPQEPKSNALSSSIVDTAISYMQANFHKPINISILCSELNISRTYFSTLFESTMKQSPYQFLQNIRIQRAAELLLNDQNLRVYEVAEMVGFSSVAQFCKTFQKLHLIRPSDFREKYLSSNKKKS